MMPGPEPRNWHTGIDPEKVIAASMNLSEAMRGQFMAFALKHGVTVNDARLLLMNGVSL